MKLAILIAIFAIALCAQSFAAQPPIIKKIPMRGHSSDSQFAKLVFVAIQKAMYRDPDADPTPTPRANKYQRKGWSLDGPAPSVADRPSSTGKRPTSVVDMLDQMQKGSVYFLDGKTANVICDGCSGSGRKKGSLCGACSGKGYASVVKLAEYLW